MLLKSKRLGSKFNGSCGALEHLESRTLFATTLFTVDPLLSSITLSGEAFGIDLDSQSDGSLKAFYSGTILADLDADSIRFLGDSSITGIEKGTFDPGNSPAVYAGSAEGPFGTDLGDAAVRDLVLDVTSVDLPLTGGNFTSSGERLIIKTGVVDYDIDGGGEGSENIAGTDGNNTTAAASSVVVGSDGITTLTIPINITLEPADFDGELTLKGTIVAKSSGTTPFIDANGPANAGTGFQGNFVVDQNTVVPAVDPTLSVSDVDDTSLVSGQVILSGAVDAGEEIAVTTGGTGISASFNSSTGALTLTGTAPIANYQQVLRSLTYTNPAANPTLGNRTITMSLNDGEDDGPASTSTITVTNPNVLVLGGGGPTAATFTDADGTLVTITYKGAGTATLNFTGANTQTAGKKSTAVTGTDVALTGIAIAGAGVTDKITFKGTGGDAVVSVANITSNAPLNTIGGKNVDLAGTLNITGRVNAATFRNVTNSTITAGSIPKLTISGALTNSAINLTDALGPVPALSTLKVTGAITGTTISSAGTINTVKAAALIDSEIYAGRVGNDQFPDATGDLSGAAISKLTLGSKGSTTPSFSNSVIAASQLGSIKLGLIDTDNGGTLTGVTADTLNSLAGTNATPQTLKVKALSDPTTAQATLDATGFTFGDVRIRIV